MQRGIEQRRSRVRLGASVLAMLLIALAVYQVGFADARRAPAPESRERNASTESSSWPRVHGGPAGARVTEAHPALDGRLVWRVALPAAASTSVVATEQTLLVALASGSLVALAAEDGRALWTASVPGQLDVPPTIAGDRAYAALRDGGVIALDVATGIERWSAGAGGGSPHAPLVVDGAVYVVAQREVRAFDAESGRVLWARAVEGSWAPPEPVAAGGRLVLARHDRVLVLDTSTGRQTFFYTLRAPVALAIGGTRVVAAGRDRVVAFDVEERRPWWEGARRAWGQLFLWGMAPEPPHPPRDWLAGAPRGALPLAVDASNVVLATSAGRIDVLALADGEEQWTVSRAPLSVPPLVTADGVLVVEGGALVLLDAATGAERARRDLDGAPLGAAVVTEHGTYVLASGGRELLALR